MCAPNINRLSFSEHILTMTEKIFVHNLLQTLCSDQELKIISQSEKKNSMPVSTGKYRFHAVDLSKSQSAHLIPCYRQLTKVNMFTWQCNVITFQKLQKIRINRWKESPKDELHILQIPCLGNTMAMHEENMVAIGRERKIIIWCIESGSCDQKLSKGKTHTFERNATILLCHFAPLKYIYHLCKILLWNVG